MMTAAASSIAAFLHVVISTVRDASLRRSLQRDVGLQLLTTLALSLLVSLVVSRIPMVELDDALLPRFVWEKNRTSVVLFAAFVVEWLVVAAWPRRARQDLDRMAAVAGLQAPLVLPSVADEVLHRVRTLTPLLLICLGWTAALCAAAWVGLHSIAPGLSDPKRLVATALVAALLLVLPVAPLFGTFVWFIADRLGRASAPQRSAAEVLRSQPGEAVGLALVALPGSLPLAHLLWRPFLTVATALVRRARMDEVQPLPPGMRADPLGDLRGQLREGFAMVRAGTLAQPEREGRVVRTLWAPALTVGAVRALRAAGPAWRRARNVVMAQLAVTFAVAMAWIATVGLTVGTRDTPVLGGKGHITVQGSATAFAAALSVFYAVEWIVIALSRQHHDAISADLSRLLGVPPDDDVTDPRVHLDRGWLWSKFKRKLQGALILMTSALPFVALVLLVSAPIAALLEHAVLFGWFLMSGVQSAANLVTTVVAAYWGAVFMLGKTGHAWRIDAGQEPLWSRVLAGVSERWPRAGWPLRAWLVVVRRTLGIVARPAALAERMPFEALGLFLMRVVCLLPGVYLVLRPLFPVVATLILKHKAPETLAAAPAAPALGMADPGSVAPAGAPDPVPASGHAS